MSVCVCVSAHMHVKGGGLPEMACNMQELHMKPYKERGCIGRGLFDKQTCYPIR